jgi:hypothetical protein
MPIKFTGQHQCLLSLFFTNAAFLNFILSQKKNMTMTLRVLSLVFQGNEEALKILKKTNTQQKNLGCSLEENKLPEERGRSKGFTYFCKSVSSVNMVMEVFLELWQIHLIKWMALVVFCFLGSVGIGHLIPGLRLEAKVTTFLPKGNSSIN